MDSDRFSYQERHEPPFDDSPEAVPQEATPVPEVGTGSNGFSSRDKFPVHDEPWYTGKSEWGDQTSTPATVTTIATTAGAAEAPTTPWWRRRKTTVVLFVVAVVVFILAIALGVGLGVGLSKKHHTVDNEQSDTTDTIPKCKGTLCPQILAATEHENSLYVFARTNDGSIAYRNYSQSSSSRWDDWKDLGTMGGGFISQPTVQSWKMGGDVPRLDVIAVSKEQNALHENWLSAEEDWAQDGNWTLRWGRADSAVSACDLPDSGLHFYVGDDSHVRSSQWVKAEDYAEKEKGGITEEMGGFTGDGKKWLAVSMSRKPGSNIGVVCTNDTTAVSLVYFDPLTDSVLYQSYEQEWDRIALEGRKASEFIGDPVVVDWKGDSSFDTFLVRKDNSLDRYPDLNDSRSLVHYDGSLLSTPAVISLGKSYDIVAPGTNGTLQHLHYDDGSDRKESEWEDLGLKAHSAPTLIKFKDEVFLFAVSESGELQSWKRDTSQSATWKDSLKSETLKGDLTLDFFTDDS